MSPFDSRRAREAKQNLGLAQKDLLKHMRPGAVFTVKDELVVFPNERLEGAGPRTKHPTRRVILMSCERACVSASVKTVLVVPCSASQSTVGSYDLEVTGQPGFDADRVVAFASLVQPLLKSDLLAHLGHLEERVAVALLGRVIDHMRISEATGGALLPPRGA